MIKIVCCGKIKDEHLKALIDDYLKRISHYHKIQVLEVKDEPIKVDEKTVLKLEGERLLSKIENDDYVILLDLHGKTVDSLALSVKVEQVFNHYGKLTFVIGGSLGLDDALRKRANEALKLSDLTFPHQLTRLLLVEQLYRCFKIINHETYHK